MNDGHLYTCKKCGCHEFDVVEEKTITQYFTITLACDDDCENFGEVAAECSFSYVTELRKTGPLDEDHHWEYEEEEVIDKYDGEKRELKVSCWSCYENSLVEQEGLWEIEKDESEYETKSEFYVVCSNCEREIEFGWSHPDRGGRIWPIESTDFTPWQSWPEPRYRESWKKKGWLRPETE